MTTTRMRLALASMCCGSLLLIAGNADAFLMRSSVIANGSDPSNNGTHHLLGTAGQGAIGISVRAGAYVCSGFWCVGGAPVLAVDPAKPADIPLEFALSPPIPNPTAGDAHMRLALPHAARVTLSVFDVSGRQVGEPVTLSFAAGYHDLKWHASAEHAGIYFGRLHVDGELKAERRIILVR